MDNARRAVVLKELVKIMQKSITAIAKCRYPVIIAVSGLCLGGGLNVMSACDIVILSADSKLSIREVKIGMAGDIGVLNRLSVSNANWSLLSELTYTGRFFNAEEAKQLGLASHILPSKKAAEDKAHSLAREIAENSPIAVYGSKLGLNSVKGKLVKQGLDFMAEHNKVSLMTNDMMTAVGSIFAKQKPIFPKL
jgi:enoyl-CoA hydratase/carnithine racemase